MLSAAENERLTRVGPGTPMGELMRRYWQPIGVTSELNARPTKPVRILGEDLVLYRDRSGEYGLIDRYCAHRRVDLSYGIPEEHGLRCMYHGWMFDADGQCIEQPFEETVHPDGRFKEKVRALLSVQEGRVAVGIHGPGSLPCCRLGTCWLGQRAGASASWCCRATGSSALKRGDPVHTEWLHVNLTSAVLEREGSIADRSEMPRRPHRKIGLDRYENGVIKRRVVEGTTEQDREWTVGHPIIFPTWVSIINGFQMRVPVDDTHTLNFFYHVYVPPEGVELEPQEEIPGYEVPYVGEDGRYLQNFVVAQDSSAWVTQGPIADRTREKLGQSDVGVIMYRKLLEEQMRLVEDGVDPMNTFRDPAENEILYSFDEYRAPGARPEKVCCNSGARSWLYHVRRRHPEGGTSPASRRYSPSHSRGGGLRKVKAGYSVRVDAPCTPAYHAPDVRNRGRHHAVNG